MQESRLRQRIGYVVAADLKPRSPDESLRTPRPEYAVFAERNTTTLLDYALLKSSRSPMARLLARRGQRTLALPYAVLPRHREFDALLASGEDVGLPLAALMRLRRVRKPLYIITHGSYFGSEKFNRMLSLVRGMSHVHYLCLSESLRQALVSRFGIAEAQTHNPAYGVDTCFFTPPESVTVNPQPIIASAGTANRDYKTLVRAVSGLDADVRIAADSAWFPTSLDIAAEALPSNVEARSYGNYVGLRQLYSTCDFVVVPLYEAKHACGYAVMAEAMAMGKTVIATRTESPGDFITEGETGFYVGVGDEKGLRERIRLLLTDPILARQMGQRARQRFEKEFSVENYCAKMEEIISRTCPS